MGGSRFVSGTDLRFSLASNVSCPKREHSVLLGLASYPSDVTLDLMIDAKSKKRGQERAVQSLYRDDSQG